MYSVMITLTGTGMKYIKACLSLNQDVVNRKTTRYGPIPRDLKLKILKAINKHKS